MVNYNDVGSITYFSRPLAECKYQIDFKKKVFISFTDNLVLDFTTKDDWTFHTGNNCTFKVGNNCTFKTGMDCTFNTGSYSIFKTGVECTFMTGSDCTFDTDGTCIFSLYDINSCTFKNYDNCSIIIDIIDKKRYVLTKEFIRLQKVINGYLMKKTRRKQKAYLEIFYNR